MTILTLLITIIVVGVLLWLVNAVIPMDAKVKQILTAVVCVILVIWLLDVFIGGLPFLSHRIG